MIEDSEAQEQEKDFTVETRRNKRARTKKKFSPDFLTYLLGNEPRTFKRSFELFRRICVKIGC